MHTMNEQERRAKALELAIDSGIAESEFEAHHKARAVLVLATSFEEWLNGQSTDSCVRTARVLDQDQSLGQGDEPQRRAYTLGEMFKGTGGIVDDPLDLGHLAPAPDVDSAIDAIARDKDGR